jgi:hypothetical protein
VPARDGTTVTTVPVGVLNSCFVSPIDTVPLHRMGVTVRVIVVPVPDKEPYVGKRLLPGIDKVIQCLHMVPPPMPIPTWPGSIRTLSLTRT